MKTPGNVETVSRRWLCSLWDYAERLKDDPATREAGVNIMATIILMRDPDEFDRPNIPPQ